MKKIALLALGFVLFAGNTFAAQTITCGSNYFNGQQLQVGLHGVVANSATLTAVTLTVGNQTAFANASAQADPTYRPRKYDGFNRFIIPVRAEWDGFGNPSDIALLLPNNLGAARNFIGYVTERASDGGSFNKIFCTLQ
jgi:hypothetical protein